MDDLKRADTMLRLLLVAVIELVMVLFCAWGREMTDISILSSNMGLGLVIWSTQRIESGLLGKMIFILVVFFHLYAVGQYLWYAGTETGQFLLFGIGMALSSSFGC